MPAVVAAGPRKPSFVGRDIPGQVIRRKVGPLAGGTRPRTRPRHKSLGTQWRGVALVNTASNYYESFGGAPHQFRPHARSPLLDAHCLLNSFLGILSIHIFSSQKNNEFFEKY